MYDIVEKLQREIPSNVFLTKYSKNLFKPTKFKHSACFLVLFTVISDCFLYKIFRPNFVLFTFGKK